MRGRIFAVASVCSGSPDFSISIVTTALSEPSWPSTVLTLPTSTPAIRTGEPGRRLLADSNTALTRWPCVNGMSLVKPRKTRIASTTSAISPTANGLRPARRRRAAAAAHQGLPSVATCWRPGGLDVTVRPAA